ncbi:tetratricopeptide repeat protein [Candidatus Sumerlaeota bacterium]|nr:tetratricopeptide repeat protein [Candidatus Sumerlaeota bacterium]
MSNDTAKPSLGHDLRRMAPVWAVVSVTALIVAFSMKSIGKSQLERAAYGNRSACEYAEVYLTVARQEMDKQREVAAKLRFESRELDKPSLGLLKGNKSLMKARADLQHAAALCPLNSEADKLLAVADWYLGDECSAIYHLGTAERRAGRHAEALIQYELVLEKCPGDQPSLVGKAVSLRELNRMDEAIALVNSHRDQIAASTEGKLAVGRALSMTTDTLAARRYLEEGLVENPSETAAVLDYSRVMKDADLEHEGADFLMGLGRGSIPTIPQVYHTASILYKESGDFTSEERALRDALRLFPNSAELCYDLGVNLYNQGKRAEAREFAKRSLDYDVNFFMQRVKETGVDPRA